MPPMFEVNTLGHLRLRRAWRVVEISIYRGRSAYHSTTKMTMVVFYLEYLLSKYDYPKLVSCS